jgi:hypothetical protein
LNFTYYLGLKLFESILEIEEECGSSMLSIFDENIDFFLDSLFQQKSNNKVFGIERLMILKFILALVNSQPGVTNFLAEKVSLQCQLNIY